jgi:hypothetical protein
VLIIECFVLQTRSSFDSLGYAFYYQNVGQALICLIKLFLGFKVCVNPCYEHACCLLRALFRHGRISLLIAVFGLAGK